METLSNPPNWLFKQRTLISNFFWKVWYNGLVSWTLWILCIFSKISAEKMFSWKKLQQSRTHLCQIWISFNIWMVNNKKWWLLLLLIIVRIAFHNEKKISKTKRIFCCYQFFLLLWESKLDRSATVCSWEVTE